jgi:RimJ/RimL family protein N-acetyltransferase
VNYFNQESPRLIYRKLTYSDVSAWSEFFIDNQNLPFLGIPENLSAREMPREWIAKQLDRYQETGFGGLAAISKTTGDLIGISGVVEKWINDHKEYEISYSLLPKYWRQGYGFEMASTMKQYAIRHKVHPRVISIIHKDNVGSIGVANKNGMAYLFDVKYQDMPCQVYGVST